MKPEDSIDQYSVAEEKAPYQSLSPSPDGVMERGLVLTMLLLSVSGVHIHKQWLFRSD